MTEVQKLLLEHENFLYWQIKELQEEHAKVKSSLELEFPKGTPIPGNTCAWQPYKERKVHEEKIPPIAYHQCAVSTFPVSRIDAVMLTRPDLNWDGVIEETTNYKLVRKGKK